VEFQHRFVADLGATVAAGNVVVGARLGLYEALGEQPLLPTELAVRTQTAARYVEEWLRGQAAGGYVEYDAETGRYWLTEEQRSALTGPVPGAFELALTALRAVPEITEAFRTGDGRGWDGHHLQLGFGPLSSWLRALDGVETKLHAGARVADVGCGLGTATVLMAQAFETSSFAGWDAHQASIEQAEKGAAEAGVSGRVRFQVAPAHDFGGGPYDLVTTFDCLHDLGDPLRAARHIRESLTPDGTWMIAEPYAGDTVPDNLSPVGRVYYGLSTFLCVPNALSQPGGYSLGAQAGEEPVRHIAHDAGFTRFRRVAETPFTIVYEARP
jgi:2-polyprenyl-3-methyl-5-hydroxy-6-metoxy-1,4-benzoquinol methylase